MIFHWIVITVITNRFFSSSIILVSKPVRFLKTLVIPLWLGRTEDGCGEVKAREGAQQPREKWELEKSGARRNVVTRKTCKRPSESLREASGNNSFYMAKMKKWESLVRVRVDDSMVP